MLAGFLCGVRPPDLGGYNVPPPRWVTTTLVVLVGCIQALTGLIYDSYHRQFSRTASRWMWLFGLPIVVFIIAACSVMAVGFSAHNKLVVGVPYIDYRIWHYVYFSIAVSAPFLLHRDPTWLRQLYFGTSFIRPFQDRFPRLLGASLCSGLLAALISVAIAELFHWPQSGRTFYGFEKGASIIGLCLIALPVQVTLAMALSLGEERPRWVQELGIAIGRLLDSPDPATRPPLLRQSLRLLIGNQRDVLRHRHDLGVVAHTLPAILPQLDTADRSQLADELGFSVVELDTRLALLSTQLAAVAQEPGAVATPLLLLRDAQSLQLGSIELSLIPDPSCATTLGLSVLRNRHLVPVNARLHAAVRRIVHVVVELASPARDHYFANGAWRLHVSFTTGDATLDEGFQGGSFELPLALALWGLLRAQRSRWPGWLATGGVEPLSLELAPPSGLAVKSLALTADRRILLTSSRALPADAPADDLGAAIIRVTDESIEATFEALRALRQQLHQRRTVVIGVPTLGQALLLLYEPPY